MLLYDYLLVGFFGVISALATGLGALPLLFKQKSEQFLGLGQAVAAAIMAIASLELVLETINDSLWLTIAGIIAGALFVKGAGYYLHKFPSMEQLIESNTAGGARQGLLIIFVMTVHSAAEGVGIGVSFGGGQELGIFISLTIALHNIPEGLAIAMVTVPHGMSVKKAALWSIFTSLPQPIVSIFAFMFVNIFESFLPLGMGFAAGAMTWIIVDELLPSALKRTSSPVIIVIFAGAFLGLTFLHIL